MATKLPQYFAGMLDVGANPDWPRVAKVLDLLQANGVHLVTAPAVVRDNGRIDLPFFTRTDTLLELMGASEGDPRSTIGALSPYKVAAYTKINPTQASGLVLDAMVKLAESDPAEGPTKPDDLRPRPEPFAAADPESVFKDLVGLSEQRDLLKKVAALVSKHGRESIECLHMAFVGAPGTGKTELARRLLAHFDALGVTSGEGTFVKASAADLLGLYVGHTPARTRAVVEKALGGVLFIDEAYALVNGSSFGQEAIDTLVELLEAHRSELVCVIAGYPHEIEELFARNPGLRDRFGMRVEFEDYAVDELDEIFHLFARSKGFCVEPDARATLRTCLTAMRGARDFANARSVRRLFDRSIMETASRTDEKVVSAADIEAAFAQKDVGGTARASRVGFGV